MKRIQRRRTKGWKMPPNTVYVGRPTKWGNPFKFGDHNIPHPMTRQDAVDWFAKCLKEGALKIRIEHIQSGLKGKNLACWCPLDQPCHADILLELANKE